MSLIESSSQVQTAYEPTIWAKLFHSVPHINITGQGVDPRFNPESDLYLESLGILASLPAAWLITTLVVLLIYLLTRCCDTKSNRKRKSRPIRCCLSFLALGCVTTLSLGFYGNHVLHKGVLEFQKAANNINTIISHGQDLADKYIAIVSDDVNDNLSHLFDGPFQRTTRTKKDQDALIDHSDVVFYNVSEGQKAMKEIKFAINDQNNPIDFRGLTDWTKSLEKYRWPLTMALQGLFTLFCLLLFVGAIVHSRCILILFSVLGLFSIILLWLLSSIYITISVASADFCYDPTPWVMHIIEDKVPRDMSTYYLQCTNSQTHPFERLIATSQRSAQDIEKHVRQISSKARNYYAHNEISPYLDDLEQSSEKIVSLMGDLISSLKCDQIYRSYNTALVSLCDNGLFGMILMLISSAISGLFFTVLVWCNSHTWIYFKHKGRYIKVDDQDPYMPLSTIERSRGGGGGGGGGLGNLGPTPSGPSTLGAYSHRHTPPQTPPYHGTLTGARNNGNAYDPLPGRRGPSMLVNPHHNTLGGPASSHRLGTLGRNTQSHGHRGMDNLPSTMTLGRRGHYSSLRNHGRNDAGDNAPMGPNFGQYPTLSKQCKTLESSDFY